MIRSSGTAKVKRPSIPLAAARCAGPCGELVSVTDLQNNRCPDCRPLGGMRLIGGASKTPVIRRQAAVKKRS